MIGFRTGNSIEGIRKLRAKEKTQVHTYVTLGFLNYYTVRADSLLQVDKKTGHFRLQAVGAAGTFPKIRNTRREVRFLLACKHPAKQFATKLVTALS
jgi:hypothetical protein